MPTRPESERLKFASPDTFAIWRAARAADNEAAMSAAYAVLVEDMLKERILMAIKETIDEAAAKFGVPVEAITSPRRKGGMIGVAREWIVERHPEMSCGDIARAFGFRDHSGISQMRTRIITRRSNACTD